MVLSAGVFVILGVRTSENFSNLASFLAIELADRLVPKPLSTCMGDEPIKYDFFQTFLQAA